MGFNPINNMSRWNSNSKNLGGKMKIEQEGWELVGHFSVDAGLVWIGDPCYILHTDEGGLPKTLGKDWSEFCDKLGNDYPTKRVFGFTEDGDGLGICLSTGYGDGTYPVYARIKEDRLVQVYIDFEDNYSYEGEDHED
jgi:hypothetical protein